MITADGPAIAAQQEIAEAQAAWQTAEAAWGAGRDRLQQIPDHELLRKIGGGSYGEVWLARHELSAQPAAVKFPLARDVLEALRREGGLVGRLHHPLVQDALPRLRRGGCRS